MASEQMRAHLEKMRTAPKREQRTIQESRASVEDGLSGQPIPSNVDIGDLDATEDLFDDSSRLEQRARRVGIPVDLVTFDGAFHVFQVYAHLPESEEAVSGIGKFFSRNIG